MRNYQAIIVILVLVAGGCAKYSPAPLTSAGVEAALRLPTRDELAARAKALRSPLLRTIDFDPAAGLTPDGAAVVAVVNHPALRAQRNRLAVADAQLLQARILPNPTLTFGLDVPFGPRSGPEAVGYGLGIDWEISALVTRDAKVQAAEAATDQVRLDVAWQEWQVAQTARRAVYDLVALRARQADAERLEKQLRAIADRSRQGLAKGDITATDNGAVQAAAQDAAVALATIRRDARDAELALNRALGVPPATPVELAAGLALPSSLDVADVETLTNNLENRRFDLVALRRGYDSQEAAVRAAILGQFPKIALGISQTRDTGDFLTIGPAVTADLPLFDRNQGAIALERATRQQLYDEYVNRVFDARADVARAVALIRSLNELIAAQAAAVGALRDLVAADETALARGNLGAATLYTATTNLSQKQAELSLSKQALMNALIDLELATGATLHAVPEAER